MRTLPILAAILLFVGCIERLPAEKPLAKSATLDIYAVLPAKGQADSVKSRKLTDPLTGETIIVAQQPIITATDVATVAKSRQTVNQTPALKVTFTP